MTKIGGGGFIYNGTALQRSAQISAGQKEGGFFLSWGVFCILFPLIVLDLKFPNFLSPSAADRSKKSGKNGDQIREKSGILDIFPDFPSISEFRNPGKFSGF